MCYTEVGCFDYNNSWFYKYPFIKFKLTFLLCNSSLMFTFEDADKYQMVY